MDRAQKRLVPFLILMYILAFLDRANVGFAKDALQMDVGISDAAFALGAGIFFVGYAIFEVPSNIILHHVGARRWLARIMITWGLVAASFALVKTETAFLALRVLLGIAEAGFFPGIIYYVTFWFTMKRRSTVMGLFYLGVPLAFIFGSPLSGLLLELNGALGLTGWQWMFMVEGLLASAVGVWAYWYLTDRPKDAKWMEKDQRESLQADLDEELRAMPAAGKKNILSAMTDPRVLLLCAIYFCIQASVYGVTFYLPTQVAKLMGQKVGFAVGVVAAIPWICALIGNMTLPKISDRTGHRGTMAALLISCSGLGVIASTSDNPYLAIAALSVAAVGFFSCQPIFWTMPSRFLSGVAAASAIGLINSVGNLGGFFAPNIRNFAEQFFNNSSAGLYILGASALLCGVLFLASVKQGMGSRTTVNGEARPLMETETPQAAGSEA